jgi:hypothetical protein
MAAAELHLQMGFSQARAWHRLVPTAAILAQQCRRTPCYPGTTELVLKLVSIVSKGVGSGLLGGGGRLILATGKWGQTPATAICLLTSRSKHNSVTHAASVVLLASFHGKH